LIYIFAVGIKKDENENSLTDPHPYKAIVDEFIKLHNKNALLKHHKISLT
jgi:hypothetical protein